MPRTKKKNCSAKRCQQKNPQPIGNFPRNSALPDGHHRYCKDCCCQASARMRQKRKENGGRIIHRIPKKDQHKNRAVAHSELTERVLFLIKETSPTYDTLKDELNARLDDIGDSIAELTVDRREVYSRIHREDGERHYHAYTAEQLAVMKTGGSHGS